MLYFEKSQPSPACLNNEKLKANGDYKCGDVLDRLKIDFKNKCYICEYKEPETINVEHFIPHRGDNTLQFNWSNLFWACSHCNNTKLALHDDILNCTEIGDDVENKLKYIFKPFPFEEVKIETLDDSQKTINTRELLLEVYNGTTKLKTIEASNLRNKLLDEIMIFQKLLIDYFKDIFDDDDKQDFLVKIKGHLNKASNFASFKRWIVLENSQLNAAFGRFIK